VNKKSSENGFIGELDVNGDGILQEGELMAVVGSGTQAASRYIIYKT
jgi:Ca2+-binding EF-hand superfamily protein